MDPFIGEIRMFGGNFAPRGWALCDGQLLAVSQNDALFALLGTIYGGDGRVTFGLPDLRGRVPIHAGSGPGLSPRNIGTKSGVENVTLTTGEIPSHTHALNAVNKTATQTDPANRQLARSVPNVYADDTPQAMASQAITQTGGNQRHENMQPFRTVNFIIALFGVFPSRT